MLVKGATDVWPAIVCFYRSNNRLRNGNIFFTTTHRSKLYIYSVLWCLIIVAVHVHTHMHYVLTHSVLFQLFLNSGSRRSQLPVWTNKQPTRMQLLNCSLRWLPLYMIILRIDPMWQKICTWFVALYRMIYLTTIFRRDSTVIRQLYDLVR